VLAQPKRWNVAPPAPESFAASLREQGLHPLLAQILYNRGHTDPQGALAFMEGEYEFPSPFSMKGIPQATARIKTAIFREEKIAVYGDFDVDGVTSTVLLVQTLRRLDAYVKGCVGASAEANITAHIPDRMTEGYGLNSKTLRRLAEQGVKLVVTVDCGIRSPQEVEDAKAAGMDVIITDHHSVGPELPGALAVIDPKQEDCAYPYHDLAGVGVAYTLARALAQVQNSRRQPPFDADGYLDLVALGTVADIAPLTGENRALVIRGLEVLNRAERPGVRTLMDVAGIAPGAVSAEGIGFALGPRLNAAGRLGSAMLAYELLSTDDHKTAHRLAQELQELNRRRQHATAQMREIAADLAGLEDGAAPPALIFAAHPEFHQGIVGLVAGRLTERFYRPSVIIERGADTSHGSCRSIPEFHITQALDRCADFLVRHGGHAAAAGFTVRNENIGVLGERLLEIAAEQLEGRDLTPTLGIDAEARLADLTEELANQLQLLEPTGEGNPRPVLATRNLRVAARRRFGRESNHLAFTVHDGEQYREAVAFRQGGLADDMPDRVDLACHLEINEWNGRRKVRLNVCDIRPTEGSS
jgi:single-stranded-DNA-specific exonuclease